MSTITMPLSCPLPTTFSPYQACEHLASTCGLQPEALPDDLLNRSSQRLQHPLDLVSHAWTSGTIRRLRLTEIFGASGTHIINIGIFPSRTSVLPFMQLEILIIKERLSLFIMDAIPSPSLGWSLDVESPSQCLRRLAAAYSELPLTEKRDEWTQSVISEDAIWSRPNTADAIVPACGAALAFLDWSAMVIQAGQAKEVSAEQTAQHIDFLNRFRKTWLANEPSRPYLGSLFGVDWAERYMSEFLFVNESHGKKEVHI